MYPHITSFILLFGVFEVPIVRGRLLPFEEYDIRLKETQGWCGRAYFSLVGEMCWRMSELMTLFCLALWVSSGYPNVSHGTDHCTRCDLASVYVPPSVAWLRPGEANYLEEQKELAGEHGLGLKNLALLRSY